MALAQLWAAGVPWDEDLPPVRACPDAERRLLSEQLESGWHCVPTSSMGRLFDAVSALIGVRQVIDYEAQAAIELEGLSRHSTDDTAAYAFATTEQAPAVIDPAPVITAIVGDLRAGVPAGVIGMRFHRTVAALTARIAAAEPMTRTIALTGGVMQNALLLRLTLQALRGSGCDVLTHRRVPPNDGGIALGQLLVGNAQ
jgi:hydrogenase maturation protein HypF